MRIPHERADQDKQENGGGGRQARRRLPGWTRQHDDVGRPSHDHEEAADRREWKIGTPILAFHHARPCDSNLASDFLLVDAYDWANFRDPDFPEWFAYAPVEGRRIHSYKGNVRKGFFHLPSRLLECCETLGE